MDPLGWPENWFWKPLPLRLISKCLYNRAPLINLICLLWAHYGRRFQKHPYGTARFVKNKRPIQLTYREQDATIQALPEFTGSEEEKVFRSVRGGRGDPCKLNHHSKGSVFPKRPTLTPSEILLSASTISRTCSPRRLRHDRMIIWL